MQNLDLSDLEEFRMKEGEVVDLGTFYLMLETFAVLFFRFFFETSQDFF